MQTLSWHVYIRIEIKQSVSMAKKTLKEVMYAGYPPLFVIWWQLKQKILYPKTQDSGNDAIRSKLAAHLEYACPSLCYCSFLFQVSTQFYTDPNPKNLGGNHMSSTLHSPR